MSSPDELKTAYAAQVEPEPKRSLLQNLKGRVAPKPAQTLQARDVLTKLQLAQSELERLQAQHGDVALDALLSVEGADANLIALETQITSARAEVVKLQSAHKAALVRDEQTILAQRASLHKAQFNTVKRQLEMRDRAAQELQDAFRIVAEKWKIMLAASKAAKAATPIGTQWPDSGLPDVIDAMGIAEIVQNEMFRQSAGSIAPGGVKLASFPGSAATPGNQLQPEKIPPLADRLRSHTAFVLTALTGKAS